MAKKSYDHLSREDLIALLKKRDSERKLGLVWERDEIEHEAALNNDFVALDLVPELSAGNAPYRNMIIEGDNFDALRYLGIAYKGRVKAIYVDPPYNTGNRDFLYNDHYMDTEDRYRHSTWLEFLYRRLMLAKNLMSANGVIMVSINDENRSKLELMMEQVFPGMRIGSFVWRSRTGGNDVKGAFMSDNQEHILVFANPGFRFTGDEKSYSMYKFQEGNRLYRLSDLTKAHDFRERPNTYYPIHDPSTGIHYPCNPQRVWAYATKHRLKKGQKTRVDTIEDLIEKNLVWFPSSQRIEVFESLHALDAAIQRKDVPMSGSTPLLFADMPDREFWIGKKIGYGRPSFKRFKDGLKNENQPISSWLTPRQEADTAVYDINMPVVGTTEEGSKILKDLMGDKVFQYPKPLSLIRAIIEQAADGPNDIVLDFFAGSATTAHAVHEINTDDGGNRSFIMVSSTEATKKDAGKNLCRDVTARRMKAVGADFAYLRAQRIPLARLHTDISHDQIWTALQQMHAGVITQYDTENALHCLDVTDTDLFYVPKITPDVITTLAKRSEHRKPAVIYSWQPGVLQQRLKSEHFAFEKIPNFLVERFGGTQ